MDITTVLILITTDEEMKKKNTEIAVKELQLEGDFGGRIGRLFIVFLSKVSTKTVQKGLLYARMIRLCYCS